MFPNLVALDMFPKGQNLISSDSLARYKEVAIETVEQNLNFPAEC